ncbi:MAG TPA: hypothetical protein ENJ40_07980 [Thermosulfurimonas dismutans]|uniref:Uncharacterized protein n=1 Tax=Thermosulfurimonas dismutans TaxID=999894 RepID=A0A7C3CP03_9BACT|nr:hypothetical protein [Thermosulfurimonas dismutans]
MAAQALWLSLVPLALILGVRAGLKWGWEKGGLVLGSALLAGVMAMPHKGGTPVALHLVRYAQHRGLSLAAQAIRLDSRMRNATKQNVTRWCLDKSHDVGTYEACVNLSYVLRLPRWLSARLSEETPWRDTRAFEQEIEKQYYRATQTEEERYASGRWERFKAAMKSDLRRLRDGLGATTKALIQQVWGGYHAIAAALGLATGHLNAKNVLRLGGGLAQMNPVEGWAFIMGQVGVHAIKVFAAAALYIAVLLWVIQGWWFACIYPIKAGALMLRDEAHIAGLRLFASYFALACAPLIWVLIFGLIAPTVSLYIHVWPALLSATYWILYQTGTVNVLAMTKYALWASLASGMMLAAPLALAILTLPWMLERWLGGLASHFAPRIFPVG